MKIDRQTVNPMDFAGLQIRDYSGNQDRSSSLAEITLPIGGHHPKAWSRKCDKFYYNLPENAFGALSVVAVLTIQLPPSGLPKSFS